MAASIYAQLQCLILFALKIVNWRVSQDEIVGPMKLRKRYLTKEVLELKASCVKPRMVGNAEQLGPPLREMIVDVKALTATSTKFRHGIAVHYFGRLNILRTMHRRQSASLKSPVSELGESALTRDLSAGDRLISRDSEVNIGNFLFSRQPCKENVFFDAISVIFSWRIGLSVRVIFLARAPYWWGNGQIGRSRLQRD